ncbi:hypothetical protein, partial [Shewanella sp.]|uniref:hypothetical protein n=1 Tax=Shewanella sp. TaxID=50422 RepID=UPI002622D4D3
GSDCKSDGSAFEGSNPSPSTISFIISISFVQLLFFIPVLSVITSSIPFVLITFFVLNCTSV